MPIMLEARGGVTRILDPNSELTQSNKITLRLKGFMRTAEGFEIRHDDRGDELSFAFSFLTDTGADVIVDDRGSEILSWRRHASDALAECRTRGRAIKDGSVEYPEIESFSRFATVGLNRPLLPHQTKAAFHLVSLRNAANFSVPGAGKTSVVLAVYEFLRKRDEVNFLFVVGPRSCFMAWSTEFQLTLGRKAATEVVAGGDVSERHQRYYRSEGDNVELYLTTYHTLTRDKDKVSLLLRHPNSRAFFVIDEAHYMKQDDGIWANAIAQTSRHAAKRCVLTGTPFPKSYADGINLFDVLYPDGNVFSGRTSGQIRRASERGDHHAARELLEPAIDSLYYRVRKRDLHLSQPVFLEPIRVRMNPVERQLYDCIEKRISELESNPVRPDLDTILSLKRGRQIRLRQAVSYPALLISAISGYTEALIDPNNTQLNTKILNYDCLETPAKMTRLVTEVQTLHRRGEKVVIWANFVRTLEKISEILGNVGLNSRVVFGGTPTESSTDDDSRDAIIERFKDSSSGLDVLVANPAACAESVSLHRTCSYAIYYDLSYNCAQYLQSLDRIHRVGGSEHKTSFYLFLQCDDTFEHKVLDNLSQKAIRMAEVIDQDFPLAVNELVDLGFGGEQFIE